MQGYCWLKAVFNLGLSVKQLHTQPYFRGWFPYWWYQFIFRQAVPKASLSLHPCQHSLSLIFLIVVILTSVRWYFIADILFLWWLLVLSIFFLCWPFVCLLWKMCIHVLCPFLSQIVLFCYELYEFHILSINILSDRWFANIFSFYRLPFASLIISYAAQKLLKQLLPLVYFCFCCLCF